MSNNQSLTKIYPTYESKSSRYKNSYQYDGWAIEDDFVIYPDPGDTQFPVDAFTAGRPDLISYALYDNPLLGWAIMRRNGLIHFSQIKAGMILWVPDREQLYSKAGILG